MSEVDLRKQFQEIHAIVQSEHSMIGSASAHFMTGAMCLITAALQLLVRLSETGAMGGIAYITSTIALLIAMILINFNGKNLFGSDTEAFNKQSLHPLIRKSFRSAYALLFAGLGLAIVWWQHIDRMIPLAIIGTGIFTNLWSRFSHKNLERMSYVMIAGGILFAGLSDIGLSKDVLVMASVFFIGAWSMVMGFLVRKYQRSENGA